MVCLNNFYCHFAYILKTCSKACFAKNLNLRADWPSLPFNCSFTLSIFNCFSVAKSGVYKIDQKTVLMYLCSQLNANHDNNQQYKMSPQERKTHFTKTDALQVCSACVTPLHIFQVFGVFRKPGRKHSFSDSRDEFTSKNVEQSNRIQIKHIAWHKTYCTCLT